MDASAQGQRIARVRRRRGLSQAALAGLVGRSESWLSQIERGLRHVDSHRVLTALAEILRADVTELTGGEQVRPQAARYTAAREIERAMMAYDALEPRSRSVTPAPRWKRAKPSICSCFQRGWRDGAVRSASTWPGPTPSNATTQPQ